MLIIQRLQALKVFSSRSLSQDYVLASSVYFYLFCKAQYFSKISLSVVEFEGSCFKKLGTMVHPDSLSHVSTRWGTRHVCSPNPLLPCVKTIISCFYMKSRQFRFTAEHAWKENGSLDIIIIDKSTQISCITVNRELDLGEVDP